MPAHLDEMNFLSPDAYKNRIAFNTATLNKGLYFSPYGITKIPPGSHVVLDENLTWYGKKSTFMFSN